MSIDWRDEEEERRRRGGAVAPLPMIPAPQPTAPQPALSPPRLPGIIDDTPPGQPAQPPVESEGFSDIDELRAAPWSTQFEQAALSRADELVNQRYDSLRQQRMGELSRRNIDPSSPLHQREMGRIGEAQARELADFRRNLQIESIDRRQRNLGQARQIETQVDEMERQRFMDLLSVLSGNPNYLTGAGNLAATLAGQTANMAAMQGLGASQSFGTAGNLFAELLNRRQANPITITFPSSPTSPPPEGVDLQDPNTWQNVPNWWENWEE